MKIRVYRVNYEKVFSPDGTVYTQTIKAGLIEKDLNAFNLYVDQLLKSDKTNSYTKLYLKHVSRGENFTNLTTAEHFIYFFELNNNSRVKFDRNTRIIIL